MEERRNNGKTVFNKYDALFQMILAKTLIGYDKK